MFLVQNRQDAAVNPGVMAHAAVAGRWSDLWRRLGARSIPDPAPILAKWGAPHRHYHGLAHLRHCLAVYDRNPLRDDRVELALWFHDAVYDAQARDNEARSAAWAAELAFAVGLQAAIIDAVNACILATRHRHEPASTAEALTVDADLAILGETRVRFARYDAAIRAEYAWVAAEDYRIGRARVLRGFLERSRIFTTTWFHRRYERRARRNLAWALRRLSA